MITLEKNNIPLDTNPDFSVQIEDQGSLAKFDDIQGTKAIGIDLPATDRNRQQLKNPERFEKIGEMNDRKFEGYILRHNGQPIMPGTLIIEDTDKSYTGWLRDLVGDLAERIKGKYINQTELGGEKTFENKTDYDPDADDYCCPKVFNRHFWRDRGKTVTNTRDITDLEGNVFERKEEIGKLTLQHFNGEQYFVNHPGGSGVVTSGIDNAPVVSPFLFLWKAVEMIFWDQKIQVTDNFLRTDADLKRLCLYHTWNICQQGFTTTSEVIYPININDPSDTLPTDADVITTVTWSADKFFYKELIPQMALGDFLLGLQNKLNIVFDFNGIDEVRIIDREAPIKSVAFDLEPYATGKWKLGTRKDVCIKLSSDTDSGDAAFEDNWQDLSDMRKYIKEPVLQRTDLNALSPELDEIRLVTGENRYYQYHWYTPEAEASDGSIQQEDVLNWERISLRFQPYFFNDGDRDQEEINSKFGTLRQSENGYPIVQQQGNSTAFKTQFSKFSPRLMFYLGDDAASFETSNLSLDYDGPNGLVAQRFRFTLPFLANALPGKRTFKLPASIYYYVRLQKNAMAFRTREGSFIIDSISAIAERASMIEAEISVLKREDNLWEFATGDTPGTGGIVTPAFVPKYIGVTANGKPYLIDASGIVKSPPAWSALSPATLAGQLCIDYSPADHLLFVAGSGGLLHIFDISNPADMKMKTIRLLLGVEISCVRFVNNHILIGQVNSVAIYQQPYFSTLAGYDDGQILGTGNNDSHLLGTVNDIVYWNGKYIACSHLGEIRESVNLDGWTQTQDWLAYLFHLVETETRIWALSNNDRNFYMLKSDGSWHEWDMASGSDPGIIEAVAVPDDKVLCITEVDYQGARLVIDTYDRNNIFTPSMAKTCRGAAVIGGEIVISIKESSGACKLATFRVPQLAWNYLAVPELFQKLIAY